MKHGLDEITQMQDEVSKYICWPGLHEGLLIDVVEEKVEISDYSITLWTLVWAEGL